MASPFKRTLVTAALPYANGPVHIGQVAGAYLPPDLFCRYLRMKGEDVVFICGSDEHGVPILIRSRLEGVDPKVIIDRYHERIKNSFAGFGIAFDYYGRTSAEIHAETSQDFFRTLADKETFVIKTDSQLFDPEANMFLADRFVMGTCPNCGFEEAYGDQCERCGTSLSPLELISPRSTITNAEPELRETTHWYMPLARFQGDLDEWIESHPEWKSNVLGQVRSWLREGLRDRAVTRDLRWGVPLPEDVARNAGVDANGKVLYVWFDAPIGYISATKEWAIAQGDPESWKTYWQDSETRLLHFIGKDNIVFHCLIFPAMLMAHGDYVLPDNVPANEFMNLEGRKLSTSRNWAVWLDEYLEGFDADLLRYALSTMLPETKDADFSWGEFQNRVNSELADVLGNFINRTLSFTHRFFDGRVPPLNDPKGVDLEVLAKLSEYPDTIGRSYESFRFREAVFETMGLARLGNKYFNDTEPWNTVKSDPHACANTVHVCLQLCASLCVLMRPVMPSVSARLEEMIGLPGVRNGEPGDTAQSAIGWADAGLSLLDAGHRIGETGILFQKVEDDVIQQQIDKLGKPLEADKSSEPVEPVKPVVSFGDFQKLDLRVGLVRSADRVKGTDKLIRLSVDLGFENRQVVAGLAEHIDPAEILGRRVVLVANLAPRKIRGLESQGMVLAAEEADGTLVLITADSEPGSIVR